MITTAVSTLLGLFCALIIYKSIRIVPQQSAYIVERLGRYHGTLTAGIHALIPFIDRVSYVLPLQEIPYDTDPQTAITRDNVQVSIDGVLYYQVTDAKSAAYGTMDFENAIEMLAQTTLRSEVGKLELDRLLEQRETINSAVVQVLDEASKGWGVKVLRYEVKDITPPHEILRAMQAQMVAERERRAVVARSEGQRAEQVNIAEGKRQAEIAQSEGDMQAAINRAKGDAEAALSIARATAEALRTVGASIGAEGGDKAVQLRVAEQYVQAFANIAKESNTIVVPANLTDLTGMITAGMSVVKGVSNQ